MKMIISYSPNEYTFWQSTCKEPLTLVFSEDLVLLFLINDLFLI